jgi:hypothetical protein
MRAARAVCGRFSACAVYPASAQERGHRGSESFFRELELSAAELADVPAAFVLPAHAEMWDVLYEEEGPDENGVQQMGIEMGELLSQWTNLELSS